jgi:hypothetical protein
MMISLLQTKGVDEFVVFLKVMIVAKEENNFVDMVLVSDG